MSMMRRSPSKKGEADAGGVSQGEAAASPFELAQVCAVVACKSRGCTEGVYILMQHAVVM